MKVHPIQKAFSKHGADMTFGTCLNFRFPVTWAEFTEAVQEVSQYVPLMRGRIEGDAIVLADHVHVGQGYTEQHVMAPTCVKAVEAEDGYELFTRHDLIDGWSMIQIRHAVMDLLKHDKAPDFRTDVAYPRVRAAGGMDLSSLRPFFGVRGQALEFCYDLPKGLIQAKAREQGVKVQELLATAVGRVMDNPAVITARIPEGYMDCVGHYTQYALGSLDRDGHYQQDCSFENFTRVLMKHGVNGTLGTAFVGSFPLGNVDYVFRRRMEFFGHHQIVKVQLSTFGDDDQIRVFLNQAVERPEEKAEAIVAYAVNGGGW